MIHSQCRYNPFCERKIDDQGSNFIDCSKTIWANGKKHFGHQYRCILCGLNTGAKVDCATENCVAPGSTKNPCMFHVTCARQAGLEVQPRDSTVKCFEHAGCMYVFRALFEDMMEIELNRNTRKEFRARIPMTWKHASRLLHAAIDIMRTLGWAWRWAEWWVEMGDNWEPFIKEGELEEEMAEQELKIVRSDPGSRCKDARRCRLAAFGAALRNRDYDKDDRDDQEPLERALTAILRTPSLVGPLAKKEIEFFVTWLALAYRSKSPVLGFGNDKCPVADDLFCIHQEDGTPKYELGSRPLPGKTAPLKGAFEPSVQEVDDFLKAPLSADPKKKARKRENTKENDEKMDNVTPPIIGSRRQRYRATKSLPQQGDCREAR